MTARILIKAGFDTASGYGSDGVGLAVALEALGIDVRLFPVTSSPPLPEEFVKLFRKPLDPPFDAAVIHVDPLHIELDRGTRMMSASCVAWTMWEFMSYQPKGRPYSARGTRQSQLHRELVKMDALIGYDQVTLDALAPHIPSTCRTEILQGGYTADQWPFVEGRDWNTTFRYIMVGQLHVRKDPFAAIYAFNELKKEHGNEFDAELHLKTNVRGLHPAMEDQYPGLKIHFKYWSLDKLREFYASAHCYLAPSRGEGKNLPALEAQSSGIPVIATNYGGHTQWLSSEYAYPLGYELAPLEKMGLCALADRKELKDLMWHVYTHREEAREKGRLASRVIPAMCDWSVVAEKFMQVLNRTPQRQIGSSLG